MIVENIGHANNTTVAWGNLIANVNDIIQYSSSTNLWTVSFDSSAATAVQYVTNLTTNVQYRYNVDDNVWMKSFEGWYEQGDYSIVI